MQQLIQSNRTGALGLVQVPVPGLQPGGVLVSTHYSLVSVGTEAMKVQTARKSLIGKARARPDLVRQVINTYRKEGLASTYRKVMNRLDTPVPLGYSLSGRVIAVAPDVEDLAVGDWVACAGAGYANHAEVVFVPKNLVAKVPRGIAIDVAAFTTVGSIAMQGVRQAVPEPGARIGVIGLGLLGQITCQLLAAAGCRVFAIDLDPARVALARDLGAEAAELRTNPMLDRAALGFTGGLGLDAVVITAATRSNDPIELAAELARDRGRIVVVGIVGMDAPHKLFYDKELELRMARSYGPGRYDPTYEEGGVDYPPAYVRWTEQRNMAAFLDMIAAGRLRLDPLITHRFPFAQARAAYDLIAGPDSRSVLGLLFEYDSVSAGGAQQPRSGIVLRHSASTPAPVRLGVVGAGNFARTMLLPRLKQNRNVDFGAIATGTPIKADDAARKFGFARVYGEASDVVADADVNTILIATRHGQHARLTAEALAAGKAVFVEKPLALNEVELAEVVRAYVASSRPFLLVGFNRRFAPLVGELRRRLPSTGPYVLQYRVNAGFVPRTHWYHDPEQGGGRLVGEGCHFIDLMLHVIGAKPVEVFAAAMDDAGVYRSDNFAVTLRFDDGSLGTLVYVANGDPALPKEWLEVSVGGVTAVLDEYRTLVVNRGGRAERIRSRSGQDKGHAGEMDGFVGALTAGRPAPIPPEQLFLSSLATVCAARSLQERRPIPVDWDGFAATIGS